MTVLIDDVSPTGAHALEIRGDAELHATGGESINPRFPTFQPEFMRGNTNTLLTGVNIGF